MEWLLIIHLGIVEIGNPQPVAYPSREACVATARRLAGEHPWIRYIDIAGDVVKPEAGVLRPSVYCQPAEWKGQPTKPSK